MVGSEPFSRGCVRGVELGRSGGGLYVRLSLGFVKEDLRRDWLLRRGWGRVTFDHHSLARVFFPLEGFVDEANGFVGILLAFNL